MAMWRGGKRRARDETKKVESLRKPGGDNQLISTIVGWDTLLLANSGKKYTWILSDNCGDVLLPE